MQQRQSKQFRQDSSKIVPYALSMAVWDLHQRQHVRYMQMWNLLAKEKAALELNEKTKRMSCDNPNRAMADDWEPKQRIQQKSVLHKVWEIRDKHHLPDQRKWSSTILKDLPPYMDLKPPEIKTWINGNLSKKDYSVEILRASHQTIDTYSDKWTHVFSFRWHFKCRLRSPDSFPW